MAQSRGLISWANPVSGNFVDKSDWAGGVVPGASDETFIDAQGTPYTVTVAANRTIYSLQEEQPNITLNVTGRDGHTTNLHPRHGFVIEGKLTVRSGATVNAETSISGLEGSALIYTGGVFETDETEEYSGSSLEVYGGTYKGGIDLEQNYVGKLLIDNGGVVQTGIYGGRTDFVATGGGTRSELQHF